MASQPIYQFYAELLDYKPKIWRRFQVLNNITMAKLGYVLMSMFEMQASHLFCFDVPDGFNQQSDHYELLSGDIFEDRDGRDIHDPAKKKIKDAVSKKDSQIVFSYDFGDSWAVRLILENIIEDIEMPGKELPRVLDGAGYGIVEDCGGVDGLKELAKAFKKKSGSQYRELSEWLGRTELDMAAFDIADANLRVKKIPRIYADIYENDTPPSQKSVDFLERKYLK